MNLSKKASFNLLRQRALDEPDLVLPSFLVEDLRSLQKEELFSRLETLGLSLKEKEFLRETEDYDTPESFFEELDGIETLSLEAQEKVFLLIFELWRRLLPEKLSLSIFCDEIDHLIYQADRDDQYESEALCDIVASLQVLLEDNVDQGVRPEDAFIAISQHVAADLPGFLYDYISFQLDSERIEYAEELVEGFFPFMKDDLWFSLLTLRLAFTKNDSVWEDLFDRFLEDVAQSPLLDLYLEVLSFLTETGRSRLFFDVVERACPLIENGQDLADLYEVSAEFLNSLGNEKGEKKLTPYIDRLTSSQEAPEELIDALLDTLEEELN